MGTQSIHVQSRGITFIHGADHRWSEMKQGPHDSTYHAAREEDRQELYIRIFDDIYLKK